MKAGDKVVCRHVRGYFFTEGKAYTVLKYEPRYPDGNYTWPAYVHVVDDLGKVVVCHASRFDKL
jgi:hypothetical protein